MDRHQTVPSEQAARHSEDRRPNCPQRHLMDFALRRDIKPIALGRVTPGVNNPPISLGPAIITIGPDGRNIHDGTSNALRIVGIVLPMRPDKPDIDHAIGIVDPHNDAIFVTRDIEDRSTVLEDTGAADVPAPAGERTPIASAPCRRIAETFSASARPSRVPRIGTRCCHPVTVTGTIPP